MYTMKKTAHGSYTICPTIPEFWWDYPDFFSYLDISIHVRPEQEKSWF